MNDNVELLPITDFSKDSNQSGEKKKKKELICQYQGYTF